MTEVRLWAAVTNVEQPEHLSAGRAEVRVGTSPVSKLPSPCTAQCFLMPRDIGRPEFDPRSPEGMFVVTAEYIPEEGRPNASRAVGCTKRWTRAPSPAMPVSFVAIVHSDLELPGATYRFGGAIVAAAIIGRGGERSPPLARPWSRAGHAVLRLALAVSRRIAGRSPCHRPVRSRRRAAGPPAPA